MEFALILVPIFVFLIAKMVLEQRAKSLADRVRLLEQALKNPAVDRATIESLTFQLTGARPARAAGAGPLMATLLAIGWIALFTGIGVYAIGEIVNENRAITGGVLTAMIGFGFVTYPFALRELDARRQAQ